jgi:uncharacterized protein (DUF302 family)
MTTVNDLRVFVAAPVETTISRIRPMLQAQGFGILTDIDVQATLREKLNEDFYPYRLLGVCNPALAYRVLEIDPSLGVFLPCTIALYDTGIGTEIHVQDPALALTMNPSPALAELAEQVRALLSRVLESLRTPTGE